MSVPNVHVPAASTGMALGEPSRVLGIDLRSSARYPTGAAVMTPDRRLRHLSTVRTDAAILALVTAHRPALIAIDAPLALPEGRCCARTDCACARHGIWRQVDRQCAALGYRPYPTLLPSMVGLTLRGIALAERLRAEGHAVVEVYPGMAQDILGVPRKQAGVAALARGLRGVGVRGIPRARRVTHDELDAATCALVAVLHRAGETFSLGNGIDAPVVAPRIAVASEV